MGRRSQSPTPTAGKSSKKEICKVKDHHHDILTVVAISLLAGYPATSQWFYRTKSMEPVRCLWLLLQKEQRCRVEIEAAPSALREVMSRG